MSSIAYLVPIIVPIACGCVLPIMIIWFGIRKKMNDTNQRTQIMLAAIEKNSEMDIEELMKKMSPKPKLLKEKLLTKLQWGSILSFLGIGSLSFALYMDYKGGSDVGELNMTYFAGFILLAIGIAFLISYFIGKKMLAKEIEAEEQILISQAENK